jgi:putative tryptophan/tyrosine transport system substrate-binding protein
VLPKASPNPEVTSLGISSRSFELAGKRLEILRAALPKISRVAVLLDTDAPVHRRQFTDMKSVAKLSGIQLQALELRVSKLDFESIFQLAISQHADALVTLLNPTNSFHFSRIVELAAKSRLPTIYPASMFADAGGLMSYGPNYSDLLHRAAYYVDRILKGIKPSDLPVEQPMKFELVINLRTAKQLGLTIAPRC